MKKTILFIILTAGHMPGADVPLDQQFEADLRRWAVADEYERPIPKSQAEWTKEKKQLRSDFRRRMGYVPQPPCPLNPVIVKRIDHDDYSIEVLYFQSRPSVYVTGVLYLPETQNGEKVPCVLNLLGHQESPTGESVQLRALALVQEGIACLSLDPFGSGQRSIHIQAPPQQELIDGHGGRPGFALGALGTPLLGLEVYDHMRALDYLQSRPEINPERLGAMGVSGGATHTQWLIAADPRVKAAAAATSIGSVVEFKEMCIMQHCPCDDLPGGFLWGTMSQNKALIAPGAFLQIICTDPGAEAQIPPGAALLRSRVQPYFNLMGVPEKLQIFIDPNPHSYSKPALEQTVAFFKRWLKNEGDGTPVPLKIDRAAVFKFLLAKGALLEPASLHGAKPESPDALLAFPGGNRPADFLTEPRFAYRRALELQARLPPPPKDKAAWKALSEPWQNTLNDVLALDDVAGDPVSFSETETPNASPEFKRVIIHSEKTIDLPSSWQAPTGTGAGFSARKTAILVDPDGKDAGELRSLREALLAAGWNTLSVDLRDTGETTWSREISQDGYVGLRDMVGEGASTWLQRPLLGRWTHDIDEAVRYVDQRKDVDQEQITVVGFGDPGLAGLLAAGRNPRIDSVVTIDALASFVSMNGFGNPWRKWLDTPALPFANVAAFVPNLFWKVADWPQLAALAAPRTLLIANPQGGDKQPLDEQAAKQTFAWTQATYEMLGKADRLHVGTALDNAEIVDWLTRTSH